MSGLDTTVDFATAECRQMTYDLVVLTARITVDESGGKAMPEITRVDHISLSWGEMLHWLVGIKPESEMYALIHKLASYHSAVFAYRPDVTLVITGEKIDD